MSGNDDEKVQEEERGYWFNVCSSLQSYKQYVENDMRRRQSRLNNLSEKFITMLPEQTFEQMWAIDQAADYNQAFLTDVSQFQKSVMSQQGMDVSQFPDSVHKGKISASEQHRNTAILHSLYREWSVQGAAERNQSFEPLLNALRKYLPVNSTNIYKQRVVVPGCGLGRLPLEISAIGYCCQGNEYSAYMAAPSNYVLNQIIQPNSYTIHPWLDR
jgi:carnosine N-methyltransferase